VAGSGKSLIFMLNIVTSKFYRISAAGKRMVRWMCGVKLQDRVPNKGLRERLGLDDIISVLQQNRMRWYGHVLRKEDNDWVKKCMEYEVEAARPRELGERLWKKTVKHVN